MPNIPITPKGIVRDSMVPNQEACRNRFALYVGHQLQAPDMPEGSC